MNGPSEEAAEDIIYVVQGQCECLVQIKPKSRLIVITNVDFALIQC